MISRNLKLKISLTINLYIIIFLSHLININDGSDFFLHFNENYSGLNRTYLFKKINEYIQLCRDGKLINHKKIRYKSKIKITSIIPVFNSDKTIKSAIRSIQNQNLMEIEILLVDDFSTDNSVDIIKK